LGRLASFMATATDIAEAHDGALITAVGDELHLSWNAVRRTAQPEVKATRAMVRMARAISEYHRGPPVVTYNPEEPTAPPRVEPRLHFSLTAATGRAHCFYGGSRRQQIFTFISLGNSRMHTRNMSAVGDRYSRYAAEVAARDLTLAAAADAAKAHHHNAAAAPLVATVPAPFTTILDHATYTAVRLNFAMLPLAVLPANADVSLGGVAGNSASAPTSRAGAGAQWSVADDQFATTTSSQGDQYGAGQDAGTVPGSCDLGRSNPMGSQGVAATATGAPSTAATMSLVISGSGGAEFACPALNEDHPAPLVSFAPEPRAPVISIDLPSTTTTPYDPTSTRSPLSQTRRLTYNPEGAWARRVVYEVIDDLEETSPSRHRQRHVTRRMPEGPGQRSGGDETTTVVSRLPTGALREQQQPPTLSAHWKGLGSSQSLGDMADAVSPISPNPCAGGDEAVVDMAPLNAFRRDGDGAVAAGCPVAQQAAAVGANGASPAATVPGVTTADVAILACKGNLEICPPRVDQLVDGTDLFELVERALRVAAFHVASGQPEAAAAHVRNLKVPPEHRAFHFFAASLLSPFAPSPTTDVGGK
jgi:hypothetical protein